MLLVPCRLQTDPVGQTACRTTHFLECGNGTAIVQVPCVVVSPSVNPRASGCGSGSPAGVTARPVKLCGPSGSPERVSGEVHGSNGAPSNWHSKVAPATPEVKVYVGAWE